MRFNRFFFCLSKGKRPAIKSVNSNEGSCENGILHNHSNPIWRTTLILPSTVSCYAVQQIFISASPRGNVQLSKLSIRTKLVVQRVFCTIIVVRMSNPIGRITLKLSCTVSCYAVQQQIFFSGSPRWNVQFKWIFAVVFLDFFFLMSEFFFHNWILFSWRFKVFSIFLPCMKCLICFQFCCFFPFCTVT